jgi:uncharacterized damage-inducible protein DinB
MILRNPREASKLIAYNEWANGQMLDAVSTLSGEEHARPVGGSFVSLHDTLVHLYGAEWIWLERSWGRSPRALPSRAQIPSFDLLRTNWRGLQQELKTFADGLQDNALARPVTYVNPKGETWSYPLADILFDLVNHSTYHRGQVATLMRQLGKTPLSTDYIRFLDAVAPKDMGPVGRSPEEISRLYAYHGWAHAKTLDSVAVLSGEEYARPVGGSFSTLRDTLAHVLGAEWVWLQRFGGDSPTALPPSQQAPTFEALKEQFRKTEERLMAVVRSSTTEGMAQTLTYVNFAGKTLVYPVGELLVHVANHATYHRGQVTTLLRQIGRTPEPTDYLLMIDERG